MLATTAGFARRNEGSSIIQFGVGGLFLNPTGGNLAANPTPFEALTIQDVSIDISQDLKELVGQYKFADDVAPGQMKITGKFSIGRIELGMLNNLFFGNTLSTGVRAIVQDEPDSVPATTTYAVTVTNSVNFDTDLGVRYAANGAPFTRVTGAPTLGQYAVSAGVYTFAATDASAKVLISYAYDSALLGKTLAITNQLMGYGPSFELWLSEPYQSVGGIPNGVHLWACRLSKLNQSLKNVDYLKPELDFTAFCNAAGAVGEFFQIAS